MLRICWKLWALQNQLEKVDRPLDYEKQQL